MQDTPLKPKDVSVQMGGLYSTLPAWRLDLDILKVPLTPKRAKEA